MKNKLLLIYGICLLIILGLVFYYLLSNNNSSNLYFNNNVIDLDVGDNLDLNDYLINLTNEDLIWTSSDTSIATIDGNGKVTGIKEGNTNIIVKTSTEETSIKVNVNAIKIKSITIKGKENIAINEKSILVVSYLPGNATDTNITWTSSNTSIVSVSSTGVITGLKEGKAVITASNNNVSNTITINVKKNYISVKSIKITGNSSVDINSSITLTTTISPSNATNKNVSYTSSDNSIATVDSSGKVTGIKSGKVIITASIDNIKDEFTVNVNYYFNVASWNIGLWHKNDKLHTYDEYSSLINKYNLNLVGLQEAKPSSGHKLTYEEGIKLIANNTSCKNYLIDTDKNAILSFIKGTGSVFTFSSSSNGQTYLKYVVKINGVTISFYNTHIMAYQSQTDNYNIAKKELVELAKAINNDSNPIILTGDFNFTTETVKTLSTLLTSDAKLKLAVTGYRYKQPFDNIYYLGKGKIDFVSSNIVETIGNQTDHNLVIAKFKTL